MRTWQRWSFAAALAGLSFAYGVYSASTQNETYRFLRHAKAVLSNRASAAPSKFNEFGQLVDYPKTERPCPPQTDKTMVAVVFGQSNAANALGQRYAAKPNVVNFFSGRC